MNILQLTSDYPPNPLWGMGWHVYFLTQSLKKQKQKVTVGTANKSRVIHEDIVTTTKDEDKTYLSPEKYEIFNNYNKFNTWQEKLARQIIRAKVSLDIIHCHNWMSWLTTKKLKEKYKRAKVIISFHFLQKQYNLMADNPIPTHHEEIIVLENEAIEQSDRIIVLSESQKDLLLSKYNNAVSNRLKTVPHGVDFEPMGYETIKAKRSVNPYTEIIFVGRLEDDKGIRQTLKAFCTLAKHNKKVRLHVVGDGPLRDELTVQYHNERIIFHGYLSREDLKNLLISSSVFCMPSSSETLGMTVIEAMYFGVTPICTKGETVPKLFEEGVHGLTVPLHLKNGVYSASVDEIFDKMKLLVDDQSLRNKLSIQAYRHANANFSLDAMTRKIIKIYEQ